MDIITKQTRKKYGLLDFRNLENMEILVKNRSFLSFLYYIIEYRKFQGFTNINVKQSQNFNITFMHLPRKESSFRMEGVERKLKTLQLLESEKSGVKMSKRSSSSSLNEKPQAVGN